MLDATHYECRIREALVAAGFGGTVTVRPFLSSVRGALVVDLRWGCEHYSLTFSSFDVAGDPNMIVDTVDRGCRNVWPPDGFHGRCWLQGLHGAIEPCRVKFDPRESPSDARTGSLTLPWMSLLRWPGGNITVAVGSEAHEVRCERRREDDGMNVVLRFRAVGEPAIAVDAAVAPEVDWRPTESIPEDFYAA